MTACVGVITGVAEYMNGEGISNAIIILSTIIVNAIRYRDSCIKTFDKNSVYEIW